MLLDGKYLWRDVSKRLTHRRPAGDGADVAAWRIRTPIRSPRCDLAFATSTPQSSPNENKSYIPSFLSVSLSLSTRYIRAVRPAVGRRVPPCACAHRWRAALRGDGCGSAVPLCVWLHVSLLRRGCACISSLSPSLSLSLSLYIYTGSSLSHDRFIYTDLKTPLPLERSLRSVATSSSVIDRPSAVFFRVRVCWWWWWCAMAAMKGDSGISRRT